MKNEINEVSNCFKERLKHDEWRFELKDLNNPDLANKICRIRAKTYEGAEKQVINRYPSDKFEIVSYMTPSGVIKMKE